jgi:hypothetical protein
MPFLTLVYHYSGRIAAVHSGSKSKWQMRGAWEGTDNNLKRNTLTELAQEQVPRNRLP